MVEFPNNPIQKKDFGDDVTEKELIQVLDRIRRNQEFMNGSFVQEDGSLADRIEVGGGLKAVIRVRPDEEKVFLLESVDVSPTISDVDYFISADDISTDASSEPFNPPKVIRDKITIEITNNKAGAETFQVFTDARLTREMIR